MIGADKVLVQKSGYYARSAPANDRDRELIHDCAVVAVKSAIDGVSGLVGMDEDQGNIIRACEFERVAGAKPFDHEVSWFRALLGDIEQPVGTPSHH
jgi:pyrophosphate--fructose-6-phosphate 1-phosphotransferase